MVSPKAQAAFAQAIPYGIVNAKAQAALDKQTLSNLPTAPANLENALLLDTPFWVNYEEDLTARFTNWAAK